MVERCKDTGSLSQGSDVAKGRPESVSPCAEVWAPAVTESKPSVRIQTSCRAHECFVTEPEVLAALGHGEAHGLLAGQVDLQGSGTL